MEELKSERGRDFLKLPRRFESTAGFKGQSVPYCHAGSRQGEWKVKGTEEGQHHGLWGPLVLQGTDGGKEGQRCG